MRLFKSFFLASCLFVSAGSAGSEYYKYVDKTGTMTFTDDLSQVPVDQRKLIESFDEVAGGAYGKVEEKKESMDEPLPYNQVDSQSWLNSLNQTKLILDSESAALKAERIMLIKESGSLDLDPHSYKKRVESLNDKIREFEKNRSQFQEDVEKFKRR